MGTRMPWRPSTYTLRLAGKASPQSPDAAGGGMGGARVKSRGFMGAQSVAHVGAQRAAGVVDAQRGLAAAQADLAHGDADAVAPLHVHLAAGGKGVAVVTGRGGGGLRAGSVDHLRLHAAGEGRSGH